MKLDRAAAAAFAMLVLAGCSALTAGPDPRPLDGTAWVLSSLPGHSALLGTTPTARFEGGNVVGTDGCNRYSMAFRQAGTSIEVGPRGLSTRMACAPEQTRQAEAFMAALTAARRVQASDAQLQLLDAGGATLASFEAQSQSLAGTSWQANGINNGRQAVVSLVTGTSVTMQFAADGRVSGTAGCNRYTANWTAKGDRLTLSRPAATRMACNASGVMEQEQAFLKALETVGVMRFEGDRLELRTTDGALAVGLARAR